MSNVKVGRTLKGVKNYTIVIGSTTFVRTSWSDIIDILGVMKASIPEINSGYGKGVYSGD